MTYAVVMKLLDGLTDHSVYMDNYYTSPTLFRDMKKLGLKACGTARLDRTGIPKAFKEKLEKGQVRTARLPGGVFGLQWMDKRMVSMLSTEEERGMTTVRRRSRQSTHTRGTEEVQKPSIIVEYNTYMGGVDQVDQMLSYYGFSHRTIKWWRRAFFHLFDLSVVNAYILYHENGGKLTHEQFRVELARQLISSVELPSTASPTALSPTSRLTDRHFMEKIPLTSTGRKVQSQCHVCCWKKGRKRVTTTYRCKQCNVPLCVVPCFELYHTHTNPVRYLQQARV